MHLIKRFRIIILLLPGFSQFSFITEVDSVKSDVPFEIYTPRPSPSPRINGPLVYGCKPGNPFLYRIPCQGIRPVTFSVKGLPASLKLDAVSGIISGSAPEKGEFDLLIEAVNSQGKDKRSLKIISGNQLALTPPMGWNSWYVHFNRVKDSDISTAADEMVKCGMADVGYQFVSIDDCWMNAEATHKYMTDNSRVGPI
jgi:alpha-galactosidase